MLGCADLVVPELPGPTMNGIDAGPVVEVDDDHDDDDGAERLWESREVSPTPDTLIMSPLSWGLRDALKVRPKTVRRSRRV